MLKKALSIAALFSMVFAAGAFAAGMFSDVAEDHWAAEGIMWANEMGLMTGSDGMFRPGDNVTRAELAVVLQRYHQMMEGGEMMEEEEMMSEYTFGMENTSEYTLSPGLLVAHSADVSMDYMGMVVGAEAGAPASLEALAEGGDVSGLMAALEGMEGVMEVWETAAVPAGETGEWMMSVPADHEGWMVSYVSMVVESNDGYVYVSGELMEWAEAMAAGNYDAGTEENSTLGRGCEGGQPGDCAEGEEGTAEDPYMEVKAHGQLTETVAEASLMMAQ